MADAPEHPDVYRHTVYVGGRALYRGTDSDFARNFFGTWSRTCKAPVEYVEERLIARSEPTP